MAKIDTKVPLHYTTLAADNTDSDHSPPRTPQFKDRGNNNKGRRPGTRFTKQNPNKALLSSLAQIGGQTGSADIQEPQPDSIALPPSPPSSLTSTTSQPAQVSEVAATDFSNLAATLESVPSDEAEAHPSDFESAAQSSTVSPGPESVPAPKTPSEEVVETQTSSSQPTGTQAQAPEITVVSRIASIPLISSTFGAINDMLSSNRYAGSYYVQAKEFSAGAYQYTLPIQKKLAPLIVRADSVANRAVDVVEWCYPSPFQAHDTQKDVANQAGG